MTSSSAGKSQRYKVRGLEVYSHKPRTVEASTAGTSTGEAGAVEHVVLVHGTLDRAAGMLAVGRRLREFHITRYDRRGYARSASTGPAESFAQQLDDLAAVIASTVSTGTVSTGTGPASTGPTGTGPTGTSRQCILFGHSFGGVLALALATQRHPNVAAVVSFEAPRAWEPWWTPPPTDDLLENSNGQDRAADAAEQFCRAMMGDQVWESLPPATRQARRSEGVTMITELQHQYIQQYDASKIEVPVIVGVGELSGPRTQRAARLTVDEAVSGESYAGELHQIAGAGHGAPTSHPDEVASLVRRAHSLQSTFSGISNSNPKTAQSQVS